MLPEVLEAIELEINKVKSSMPSSDPELLTQYRQLLIDSNQDTISVDFLRRPEFRIVTTKEKELRKLRTLYWSKKFRKLSIAVKDALGNPLDLLTYEILRAARDLK